MTDKKCEECASKTWPVQEKPSLDQHSHQERPWNTNTDAINFEMPQQVETWHLHVHEPSNVLLIHITILMEHTEQLEGQD